MNDASPRYRLDASPDWQALIRHFELGTGFAFVVLLVPDEEGERACRAALERFLGERGQTIVDIPCEKPEDLEYVAQPILELRPEAPAGAVWLGRVVEKGSGDEAVWSEAWRRGVARLNQFRNPLRRALSVPLIFAGSPQLQVILRENAPDLWSVRTLVSVVEPAPVVARGERAPQPRTPEMPAYRPDPELAMEEVERLRRSEGSELEIARALHRAGIGFAAGSEWQAADAAFSEALDLRRQFGAPAQEVADTAYELGRVLEWLAEYGRAVSLLAEAAELRREIGDVVGEANCLRNLGVVAERSSEYDEARRRYEEALAMYRRVDNAQGEANCLMSLGDIAFSRSEHGEARRRHEEALAIYQRVGDLLGEANCVLSLGQIALERSEYEEARRRYEQALPMYRRVEDVLGEANCVTALGDLALRRLEHEEARRRYEEALPMHRQIGHALGEATCVLRLGQIALGRSQHEEARRRFDAALPMFRRVGFAQGEADCLQGLGEVAFAQGNVKEACERFEAALELYRRIPEPFSIGEVERRLARLATDRVEAAKHVAAARECWTRIDRPDLVAALDKEFGRATNSPPERPSSLTE